MKYITLSPRDGDTGEFPTLGISFSFDESGRVVLCYPPALVFAKRKGAGTSRRERHLRRLDRSESND